CIPHILGLRSRHEAVISRERISKIAVHGMKYQSDEPNAQSIFTFPGIKCPFASPGDLGGG
ncbi:hypothetical protein, partial [Rhizobium mayense]|uniref:hypothetical protein n=1 Tax=Rhizobium mayense TaxID=1312184 RepID=UPI00398C49FC